VCSAISARGETTMNHAELSERIQTVLDGLATPDEERELERLLERDASARAAFNQWQRLFVALGRVPQAAPPEGLVAAVSAAAEARRAELNDAHQPFGTIDVIGDKRRERRTSSSWFVTGIGRYLGSGSTTENGIMSEQQQRSVFGNRKLWAGGAVAVLAVGVAMVAFDLPPKGDNVIGTVAPAERYRAPQDNAEPVKLADQTVAQLMQNDNFDRIVKDPQLQALSQDAGIRVLAQVMARSPEASRMILSNVEASRAASENVALAQALLGNVEASRAELAAVQAERNRANAVEAGRAEAGLQAERARMNAVEAGRVEAGLQAERARMNAVEAGRVEAGLQAERTRMNAAEAGRADLNRLIAQKFEASQAILASVEASRAALQNVAVAQAVLSNVEAGRVLLNVDASRATLQAAEAGRMVQKAEASRVQLDRAASADRKAAGN